VNKRRKHNELKTETKKARATGKKIRATRKQMKTK
jgi:hypothetical protein